MFNFKLSKRICVSGMNDCNTEKRHECTNIVQLQTTRIMKATVTDVVKGPVFTTFRAVCFFLTDVQTDKIFKQRSRIP